MCERCWGSHFEHVNRNHYRLPSEDSFEKGDWVEWVEETKPVDPGNDLYEGIWRVVELEDRGVMMTYTIEKGNAKTRNILANQLKRVTPTESQILNLTENI